MAEVFSVITQSDMGELAGYAATFVAYGVGLSIAFWTLGYLVWFIVQLMR